MKQAFPDFIDRLLLLGGALGFLAVFAGCVLVGLLLLCSESKRSFEPDEDDSTPRPGRLIPILAVVLGGTLFVFSCAWWLKEAMVHPVRHGPVPPLAARVPEAPAVHLFPWD